jgi:asparagine synthase (glutamine-hydrolysing)
MCGIIGATQSSEKAVRNSLATFSYRGPDAQSYFSNGDITLGHARLSILDLDARANQPFFDTDKKISIVYNGEIYNYKELRTELEREHHVTFRTTSDTEVLLYGYRVWGEALLPKLRGMFAFGVYDLQARTVFLARDHAGIKPLYYSLSNKRLFFASELKGVLALMRAEDLKIELDRGACVSYPILGYVPSPRTLVEGVLKLERGSWLRYDLQTKGVTHGSWKPVTQDINSVEEMQEALRRSVLEHCIADVSVGTFFSGGVDSSLISAILNEAGMNLNTYSIRVAGRPADEPYFREIAKQLGVRAHVAEFGLKEFEATYEDILSRVDDPIADTALFPATFVARQAAKEVKVVLTGEGGDELFLGYPRMQTLRRLQGKRSDFFDKTFLSTSSFPGKNKLFAKLAKASGLSVEYYLLATSPGRDFASTHGLESVGKSLLQGEALWYDLDWYLENMLLHKTDMATSYASIEGRVPLLGVELWNAAPHFVEENMAHNGTKNILKDMLATYIPRELIDRPKAGFGLDIEALFRESAFLERDLHSALLALQPLGFTKEEGEEKLIATRYPVYGFGLIMLHYSLKNLGLL